MTPALLKEAGEALYGRGFRLALADALHVDERTVRRWLVGYSPIPDGIAEELATLCETQAERLIGLCQRLDPGEVGSGR